MNESRVLKSPSFPYVSRSWQLNTFDEYVEFRSHHTKAKSNRSLIKALLSLVLSIALFSILSEKGHSLNQAYQYTLFLMASATLGIGTSMIYRYYRKVPIVVMTDEQRSLYSWPESFPSTPPSSSSSSSKSINKSIPLKMPSPINSPINNSPSTNNNTINTPKITSPMSAHLYRSIGGATNSPSVNRSIDDIENEKMMNNFNGRLFTTLCEFENQPIDHESILSKKEQQERDKDKKIYEIEHIGTQYYEAPTNFQSYRVLQKSKVTDETIPKASYEEVVSMKNTLYKSLCDSEHLYNMTECANLCAKWFTENILKPLAAPAEAYLGVKDELLLQDDGSKILTKFSFIKTMPNVEIMKNVLKYTVYHLDKFNDVHHKKENEHVCRRIKDLAKESHVFPVFGNKSTDPQNDLLQQPTDEQLLFALFLAYMDERINRDVTAQNPDLPFSTKFLKEENSKYSVKFIPLINITYKRPLHLDILVPNNQSHKMWDISPGFYNIFYTIVLFFYCITKFNNGYIENYDISQLNVDIFLNPLLSNNDSDDDIEFDD